MVATLAPVFGREDSFSSVARHVVFWIILSQRARGRRRRNRRGQAVVEFAVVAFVVYILLAGILTFGQILYTAQTLQQAADVAAREISRTPLPPTADLMDVLYGDASTDASWQDVRKRVFDDQYLVLTIDAGSSPITFNGGLALGDLPVLNQQLVLLMIPVQPAADGPKYLVYPGMVLCTDTQDTSRKVPCIAQVTSRDFKRRRNGSFGSNHRGNQGRGLFCGIRSARSRGAADQLSLSVGDHERFRAEKSVGPDRTG